MQIYSACARCQCVNVFIGSLQNQYNLTKLSADRTNANQHVKTNTDFNRTRKKIQQWLTSKFYRLTDNITCDNSDFGGGKSVWKKSKWPVACFRCFTFWFVQDWNRNLKTVFGFIKTSDFHEEYSSDANNSCELLHRRLKSVRVTKARADSTNENTRGRNILQFDAHALSFLEINWTT